MQDRQNWNWEEGERVIADLVSLGKQYSEIHEPAVSPDGEKFGVPVLSGEGNAKVWVSGQTWESDFERAWSLRFTSDGRLVALVRADDAWTVSVDGKPWEEEFDFVWNLKLSPDGKAIAVQIKQGMDYSMALNGKLWGSKYKSLRDFAFSPDGKRIAATVQVEPLPEADIFKFRQGTWSVAVDGVPWERKFVNVYTPIFSPDNRSVAAQVRVGINDYTLATDGKPWDAIFGCTWDPLYLPDGGLVVPVRVEGGWTLARNGKPIWDRRFLQLWHQTASPGGDHLAAIAATSYCDWTVVRDGTPWNESFSDMVLPKPVFSPDGKRIAVVGKQDNRWSFCVDGRRWSLEFDMAWEPVFSPDGSQVVAKVERNGKYGLILNDHLWSRQFEMLWSPSFSPDGRKLLVPGVIGGKVVRQVVPVDKIRGG